jgi:hypothetical protein
MFPLPEIPHNAGGSIPKRGRHRTVPLLLRLGVLIVRAEDRHKKALLDRSEQG